MSTLESAARSLRCSPALIVFRYGVLFAALLPEHQRPHLCRPVKCRRSVPMFFTALPPDPPRDQGRDVMRNLRLAERSENMWDTPKARVRSCSEHCNRQFPRLSEIHRPYSRTLGNRGRHFGCFPGPSRCLVLHRRRCVRRQPRYPPFAAPFERTCLRAGTRGLDIVPCLRFSVNSASFAAQDSRFSIGAYNSHV